MMMKNRIDMMKVCAFVLALSMVVGGAAFAANKDANINTGTTLIADRVVENYNMINKVKVGKTITVTVDENVTTGYEWSIKVDGDKKSVKTSFVDAKIEIKDKKTDGQTTQPLICGAGVKKTLEVKGLAPGKATITMTYARPFEKAVEPIKTMVFVVEVLK